MRTARAALLVLSGAACGTPAGGPSPLDAGTEVVVPAKEAPPRGDEPIVSVDAGARTPVDAGPPGPWLAYPRPVVTGPDSFTTDCRAAVCRHNEDTDLVTYKGAIWLVHRTAWSQALGPISSLLVYRSTDDGTTFTEVARIPAPSGRDIRDPHFYVAGGVLHLKALVRLPSAPWNALGAATVSMVARSSDGVTRSSLASIGPVAQSFWRPRERAGVHYVASYADGDTHVTLFRSSDGQTWSPGATILTSPADAPSETEILFTPSGKLLALVRMDGTTLESLGDIGRLRTKVCFADPPAYDAFTCSQELTGQRLDGPLAFFAGSRLFVVARKHLQGTGKKRTSLFEIGGTIEGGPITIKERAELPSAGDTSYAGVATRSDGKAVLSWYSGDLAKDEAWVTGMAAPTQIWVANLDVSSLGP